MTREELKNWILAEFSGTSSEIMEVSRAQKVEIFRVDLAEVSSVAKEKLAREAGDFESENSGENSSKLGDFERETFRKILAKFEQTEEKNPIFAVLDEREFPVSFEVKTGAPLAKLLREKESVVPSKLLGEREWSRVIGFGQVSVSEAQDLLRLSYRLATEE